MWPSAWSLRLVFGILFWVPSVASAQEPHPSPFTPPKAFVSGIATSIELGPGPSPGAPYTLELSKEGQSIAAYSGSLPDKIEGVILPEGGVYDIEVQSGGARWQTSVRAYPGIATLLPPLLAILMALIFRQVVIALFAGVWLGAFLINDYATLRSFFYVVDHYVVDSLSGDGGAEHVSIGIFTLLLGGMVGVFSRIGGTQGVVNAISKLATTPRRGQLATWLMGIAVFFDDYTNTLIVGNTMRPITDKLKISREKLAYIVDSTAAPVACIAVITSWIGFEISLIKDAFDTLGVDRNPFTTFVASVPYSFYPIVALLFGLMVAVSTRDFGPMLKAERRARTTGELLAKKATPLSTIDTEVAFEAGRAPRWFNAAIPIAVVVIGTFVGLMVTGRTSLMDSGITGYSAMDMIRESDSFVALLWSSLAGCVVAIVLGLAQRLATVTEIMNAWVAGVKSMIPAIIILVLAWCIGAVCSDLRTADYLVAKVSGIISPGMLPTIIFLVAAAISFSTGTSWGTMTILTPITIPLVIKISELNALAPGPHEIILLSGISAVLAGSVFGDHCSPISDTTIMSSMASGADHVDHVRTQLPYAVAAALIAALLGYLPVGYNVPAVVGLAACAIAVYGVIRLLGKPEISFSGD